MVAKPHGGRLVNLVAKGKRAERLRQEALEAPKLQITL